MTVRFDTAFNAVELAMRSPYPVRVIGRTSTHVRTFVEDALNVAARGAWGVLGGGTYYVRGKDKSQPEARARVHAIGQDFVEDRTRGCRYAAVVMLDGCEIPDQQQRYLFSRLVHEEVELPSFAQRMRARRAGRA